MAAQRKVFQELGIQAIDCTPADMKFITRIHYAAPSDGGKWAEHEIDYILFMKQKKVPIIYFFDGRSLSRHKQSLFI